MLPNSINERRSFIPPLYAWAGFTLLELLITISIIGIMVGALVAMKGPFEHRQRLEISAVTLLGDLRQTQQFARVQRVGNIGGIDYPYKYYGLRFYGNLGENSDREGWKIVRYEPPSGKDPIDMDPSVPGDLAFDRVRVIKSSELTDNPELIENTFFGENVTIDGASELQINPVAPKRHSIVFTPEGSATKDGDLNNLLDQDTDDIILSAYGNPITIHITPLTGHVRIQ